MSWELLWVLNCERCDATIATSIEGIWIPPGPGAYAPMSAEKPHAMPPPEVCFQDVEDREDGIRWKVLCFGCNKTVLGKPTQEDLDAGCDCELPHGEGVKMISNDCPVHG